jgi:hypothetical protein
MDASINADESELFGTPSYVDESPRTVSHVKGRYIVPKAPKEVRDEAQEALTAALDQVPNTIHFNQRGKGLQQPFMWETWSSRHAPRS